MNKFRCLYAGLVFLLLVSQYGFSQAVYRFQSYGLQSGLKYTSSRNMIRDSQGFTWISTDKGLYRYDGNSFFSFINLQHDTTTIASNRCNGLLLDEKHQLWVNTDNGLSRYNRQEQNFTNYEVNNDVLTNNGYDYTEMAEDSDHHIWMGGNHDVLIFDPKEKRFKTSGWIDFAKKSGIIKRELRNSISQCIRKKSKDELWILSVYGLFSVNTKSMQFAYHENLLINDYFAFKISCIDSDGVVWISSYNQCFFSYDPQTRKWAQHECPESRDILQNYIADILVDGNDLIVFDGQRAFKYLKSSKEYFPIEMDKSLSKFIRGNDFIRSVHKFGDDVFVSKSGDNPLIRLKKINSSIERVTIPLLEKYKNNTTVFLKSKNKALVGDWTYGYMFCCDQYTCKALNKQNENFGMLQQYFYYDEEISFLSTSNKIYAFDEKQDRITEIKNPSNFVEHENTEFRNFVKDKNDIVYVRERNTGIYIVNKKSLQMNHLDVGLPYENYSALCYDPSSHSLWISIDNRGLFIYDILKKTSTRYTDNKLFKSNNLFVNDIQSDNKGNIYILMKGKGILCINSKDKVSNHFTTSEGLISDEVKYGLIDDNNNLWFTTDMGLMVYQSALGTFKSFESELESQFLTDRIFLNNEGDICQNLYPNAYLEVNRSILNSNVANGVIYLKSILSIEKYLPIDPVYNLAHHQNTLTMQFGYLNNQNFYLPQFEYNINDTNWKMLPDNQTISLFNLPPGVYDVTIRDHKSIGVSSNIKITIEVPWWKSWIFFTILSTSILGFGIWAYKFRVRIIRHEEAEKNELKQRIARTEMAALRAQMNPHFIFNCLNSINRFILVNDTDAASDYLSKFAKLIRVILDSSKEELITFDKELEALRLYIGIESMRFNDTFKWNIQIDEGVLTDQLMVPPLLLQPYVENAIWHGLMQSPHHVEKKLLIHVFLADDHATVIQISDTGIGRKNAEVLKSKSANNRKSYGMLLTEERLKLMYETLKIKGVINIEDGNVNSIEQSGTVVTLKIYSNESHYSG